MLSNRLFGLSHIVVFGVALVTGVRFAAAEANWPQFRGPRADGVADGATFPDKWSATDNVAWTAQIPGRGWSSPIVWGNRVYITSAINAAEFKQPSTGIFGPELLAESIKGGLSQEDAYKVVQKRDVEFPAESAEVRYMLYSLDVQTGKILWEREAHRGLPFGGRHRKNTYATETPVTDGERVYAYFGNVGLFCYTLDGKLLWSHRWDPQPMFLDFGTASSPVLHGNRIYVKLDSDAKGFLAALDGRTGKEIWSVPRGDAAGKSRSSWSTPYIWKTPLRTEIVATGQRMVISYDLDGKELWRMRGFSAGAPTPLAVGELLYAGTGSQGETNRPMAAIKPGASGDITLAEGTTSSDHVAWFNPLGSAYTPSPLVYRDRIYVPNDNGILTVLDARAGKVVYKARIGGGGNTFSASPWAAGGKVFCLSEDGDTFVFTAGDEYNELGKNSLGQMSLASPAVSGDSLFIRTATTLYRIAAETNTEDGHE